MSQDERPPSLDDLDSRLRKVRKDRETTASRWGRVPDSSFGRALHLAIEMAASLAVGVGLGWFLDHWLGTKPWLLIVFVFLGVGAAVRNAFRLAKQYEAEVERKKEDGGTDGPTG